MVVKVLKAEQMRTSTSGSAPEPMMKLRIHVDGTFGPYSSTSKVDSTTEASWNEEVTLGVKDPSNSQLECTLWDESDGTASEPQKFLGQVILNLAKLVPYNNTYIEQEFEIKQGKNYKATAEDKKATGKLKLGLKLVIPSDSPGESDDFRGTASASYSIRKLRIETLLAIPLLLYAYHPFNACSRSHLMLALLASIK
jgi:hypothetical protein